MVSIQACRWVSITGKLHCGFRGRGWRGGVILFTPMQSTAKLYLAHNGWFPQALHLNVTRLWWSQWAHRDSPVWEIIRNKKIIPWSCAAMVLIYYAKRGGTCFGKKLVRWEQCSPGIYIAGIYLLACLLPLLCWKAMVRASKLYLPSCH